VEQVAPWSPDVLDERWLSRTEQLALTGLRPEDRPVAVTRAWTQKEAVLKARGTGLRDDPAAAVTVIGRPEGTVAGWEISDVPVPEGWVASLAVGAASDKEMPS
jgi:4'-phosphopantetheinyl transferase